MRGAFHSEVQRIEQELARAKRQVKEMESQVSNSSVQDNEIVGMAQVTAQGTRHRAPGTGHQAQGREY